MSYFGLGMGLGGPPALVRGPHIAGAGLLPELVAYRDTTDATDLSGLNNLAGYLLDQSLYNDTMFASFKAAQNYGSGSAAATLGGAQANEWTLVNGPTWGSDGLGLETGQAMRIADFLAGGINLTVFLRCTRTVSSDDRYLISQYDTTANQRSWGLAELGQWIGYKSDNGTNLGSANGGTSNSGADTVFVIQFEEGVGGGRFFTNDVERTMSSAAAFNGIMTLHDSTADIVIGGRTGDGALAVANGPMLATAAAILRQTLPTQTQRETIRNLLSAL